jgi:hypothetical protein
MGFDGRRCGDQWRIHLGLTLRIADSGALRRYVRQDMVVNRRAAKHCRTTEAMLKLPLWRTLRGHCCASAAGLTGSSYISRRKAVWAGVAQLVEHLICNQRVGGSSPFASSSFIQQVSSRKDGFGCTACRSGFADLRSLLQGLNTRFGSLSESRHGLDGLRCGLRAGVLSRMCTGGRVVNGSRL